jgi:hypothetical protein
MKRRLRVSRKINGESLGACVGSELGVRFIATFVVVSIIFISGCTGDSAFRVTGSIRDDAGRPVDGCNMKVSFSQGGPAHSQKLDSSFTNTFTVDPGGHRVILNIICDDNKVFTSPFYEIEGNKKYYAPIDLGVIVVSDN